MPGIPIYHMTHIDNIPGILANQGLLSDNAILALGSIPISIAHTNIKQRRTRINVVVSGMNKGVLADYVPFYFCARSPMLYAIHSGMVQDCSCSQLDIAYIVTTVESVANNPYSRWCFSDGHPVEAITDFYDDLVYLDKIDWNVVNSWSWGNTELDNDRKRRKQAEFLVYKTVPWELVECIGVYGHNEQSRVLNVINTGGHVPDVQIHRKWYYD